MIRVQIEDDHRMLDWNLNPGTAAYVDAEWVVAEGRVPALVVEGKDTAARDRAARARLAALAERALGACETSAEPLLVTGTGAVAAELRRLAGPRTARADVDAPAAAIDTTGDQKTVLRTIGRLADLGTLVLAGPGPDRIDINLYPDVHVRGLRIVGIGEPDDQGEADSLKSDQSPISPPTRVTRGERLPRAVWYVLEADQ